MARVVRKVSNKASKEQKRTNPNNKKRNIWIGSIVAAIIVIAAVVVTIILCNNGGSNNSFYDYLADEQTVKIEDQEYKVSFTKMSYSGVLYHHNNTNEANEYEELSYYKYVFVYAQDFHSFYPDKDKNSDKYSSDDEELLSRLARFQARVDNYNKEVGSNSEEKAIFFLVDTYYDYNKGIFDDTNFRTTSDDNLTSLFCLFAGRGIDGNQMGLVQYTFTCNVDGENQKLTMYDTNNGFSMDRGSQAYNLIKSGFNNYEKGYKED